MSPGSPGIAPPISSPERPRYWALVCIVAAGAGLRLWQLDGQSLWHDEAISLTVARAPLAQIPAFFQSQEGRLPFEYNPPVYAYLLHVWLAIFGSGDWQARLLSAFAGAGAIVALYALGRRLFGEAAGLMAALLLAVSQLGVMVAQEARHYALFMLLVLMTAWCFWVAMERRRLAAWVAMLACAVLMVGTQYYGAFVLLALAVVAAIYWRPLPWRWFAGAAITMAATLGPWFAFAFEGQFRAASDRVQPEYFAMSVSRVASTIARFGNGAVDGLLQSVPAWSFLVSAALFVVPLLFGAWRAWTSRQAAAEATARRALAFALVLWGVPLACVFVLGFALNVQYNIRYAAFLVAPFYLLVAAGLSQLPARVHLAFMSLIVGYSGYALHANFAVPYKENYRDAIALVSQDARAGDCFAFVPFGSPPLQWALYEGVEPVRRLRLRDGDGADCPRTWVITYERVRQPGHSAWRERLEPILDRHVRVVDRRLFWVRVERFDVQASVR
jgi:4-amino-4-deoxy-L-arabinose transferase-like glycosyltransferase